MSKKRRRRLRDPGQYVSPLMNELKWLDEQPDETTASVKMKKRTRAKSQTKSNPVSGKMTERSGTAKPEVFAASLPIAPNRRGEPKSPPLLLLNKQKPQAGGSRLVRELFGYDSWAAQQADQIVDAIQAFQLGLDGFLKEGELLSVVPSRDQSAIIDITPEPAPEPEAWASSPHNPSTEPVKEAADKIGKEQQLYGLIPFRFDPLDERVDLKITFGQPFVNDRYVLVATADQNGCRTVIQEKTPESAVVRLIRGLDDSVSEGELNWIAIGDG